MRPAIARTTTDFAPAITSSVVQVDQRELDDVVPFPQQTMARTARTKQAGRLSEPTLPVRTIVSERGVTIEQLYSSWGDHGPPHVHVFGPGSAKTRIGQNGRPLRRDPPLTADQEAVVQANRALIRRVVRKIGRWYWFQQQPG